MSDQATTQTTTEAPSMPQPKYTPDQLPRQTSDFIAYGPSVYVMHPTEPDEQVTVRSQTLVKYYPSINISRIERSNDSVTKVHFDPASIGFSKPVYANIDPDDPLLPYIEQEFDAKRPVDIAIESLRKGKHGETKERISPFRHIHALRGAQDADGTKPQTDESFRTCRKMLVMVNGRPGRALGSNPAEWTMLATNRAGQLAPSGWKVFRFNDDWRDQGSITPKDPSGQTPSGQNPQSAAPSGPVDTEALIRAMAPGLTAVIQQAVKDEFHRRDEASEQGRPVGRGFTEGKPWDLRTSDGRPNLGSYVSSEWGDLMRWAHWHLTTGEDTDTPVYPESEQADALAKAAMECADDVQVVTYGGHGMERDRRSLSHREAVYWVKWAIRCYHPVTVEDMALDEDWRNQVIETATMRFHVQRGNVQDYLNDEAAKHKRTKDERSAKAAEEQAQSDEPQASVVNALLGTVAKRWDDLGTLTNVSNQVIERGWTGLDVSVTTTEQGVAITYPPVEGQKSGPLGDLLKSRWIAVKNAADDKGGVEPDAEKDRGADEGDRQDDSTRESGGAGEGQRADASERTTSEQPLDQTTVGFVNRLKGVTSEAHVKDLFERAEKNNFLATKIPVRENGEGLEYGTAVDQDGFQTWTAAQVLDRLASQFTKAPAAAEDDNPQGDEPEPEEAPETEASPEEEPSTSAPDPAPDAPAPTGDDAEAQRIADAVAETYTKFENGEMLAGDAEQEIEKLRAKGADADLLLRKIAVGNNKGALSGWIKSRLLRIQKASA